MTKLILEINTREIISYKFKTQINIFTVDFVMNETYTFLLSLN